MEELVGQDGCVDVKHKTGVGAVGSIREGEPIERGKDRLDNAVAFVKVFLSLGWWKLIVFSGGHQVNSAFGKVCFEAFADVSLIPGDNRVGQIAE